MERSIVNTGKVAPAEPQAYYHAYFFGYKHKHKFIYFINTIREMYKYLQPISELT